MAILTR